MPHLEDHEIEDLGKYMWQLESMHDPYDLHSTQKKMSWFVRRLVAEHRDRGTTLEFYAEPDTYYAIGFFPDPPCGDFMDDFTNVDSGSVYGMKPGRRAREALGWKSYDIPEEEANG